MMRNMMFCFLAGALITSMVTGCGGKKDLPPMETPELDADSKLTLYTDDEHSYYFHYPKDWKLYDQLKTIADEEKRKQSGNQKTILISPFDGNNVESLNISFVTQFHDKVEVTLNDAFVEQTKKHYEASGQKVLDIELGTFEDKYPAVIAKVSKETGDQTTITKQYIFIVGTRLFIITLQGWDMYYNEFEEPFDSFLDKVHIQE